MGGRGAAGGGGGSKKEGKRKGRRSAAQIDYDETKERLGREKEYLSRDMNELEFLSQEAKSGKNVTYGRNVTLRSIEVRKRKIKRLEGHLRNLKKKNPGLS